MKNILLACLAFVLFSACNKKVDELPPATQTGANTFGAKIDGNLWVPRGFAGLPANDILEARFTSPTSIMINASDFSKSPNETEFEIQLINITGPGTYQLNTDVTRPAFANYAYYVKRNLTPKYEWITSSTNTGTVTLTRFDNVNNIASGTFQFSGQNIYGGVANISVTEGRFDVSLQ